MSDKPTARTVLIEDELSFLPTVPIDGDPTDIPEPDYTPPEVTFLEPAENSVWQAGQAPTFRFRVSDAESGVRSVQWSLNGGAYQAATRDATIGVWRASPTLPHRGDHTLRVRAVNNAFDTGANETVVARKVSAFDPTPPNQIEVVHPGAEVSAAVVPLEVRAGDSDPWSNVGAVTWSLDGVTFKDAQRSGEAGGISTWKAGMPLPSATVPVGGKPYTLIVRVYNLDNRYAERKVTFTAIDRTGPALEITSPAADGSEISGDQSGAVVALRGRAVDAPGGTALTCGVDRVEWSLDGRTYQRALLGAGGEWNAEIRIPPRGQQTIRVRSYDKQGNIGTPAEATRTVVTALPFTVSDLSARSYLKDLLDFAKLRVRQWTAGPEVEPPLLAATFHQPFAGLVDATDDAASRLTHQVRIAVDVLRDYLAPRPVAHWAFEEGSGAVVTDSSGNGNTGSVQGATRVPGKVGSALAFDGVDDVVTLSQVSFRDIVNSFTIAFWASPQATHEIDTQATGGSSGIAGQRYAIDPRQGGTFYGSPDHSCAGISVGTNGVSVYEHTDYYMPALLVHQAAITGWTHVAVVYEDRTPKLYLNGVLAKTGLPSPKPFVHVNPEKLGGSAHNYGFYKGQLDDVRVYGRPLSAAEVRRLVSPTGSDEVVWVDDALPAGATQGADGGDAWTWVGANPAPAAGRLAHQSAIAPGVHQHLFTGAASGLPVDAGDRLSAEIYLDPANVPDMVMLQWNDGSWEHRAYWGKNQSPWGTDGTASRRSMGPLPTAGRWVRLEVPAALVGLEGRVVTGMAFTLSGGRATWDRAGKSGAAAALAAAEADYRRAAYQTLLSNLGTSYEELRLAHVADDAIRQALADRLGITIPPADAKARPDNLDKLLLPLEQVTEADLERVFGLEVTTRLPLGGTAPAEPQLLSWRRERLRTDWKLEDDKAAAPIVDPDLIGKDDLRAPVAGDPAFTLWTARRGWVEARLAELRSKRASKATPLEGFDHVVGDMLAPFTLAGLAAEREAGGGIEAKLGEKGLTVAGFDFLLRVRALAEANSVLDPEWEEVYSILVQAAKVRPEGMHKTWWAEEKARNLHLGPDSFVVADSAMSALPAWRATERARRAWQRRLQARISQWEAAAAALAATVDATEEADLPRLREALIAAVPGRAGVDTAEALTRRLQIDLKSSGDLRTTRVDQAVETLQGALFSLRAGRFREQAVKLGPHPAAAWVLEQRTDYKEEHFDQELRWMGAADPWRAAMFAFLYPENLLLPSLREDQTEAFRSLVGSLRKLPGLTPGEAREQARGYLAALRADASVPALHQALGPAFTITEQLDEAQLLALSGRIAALWNNTALSAPKIRTYLRELFYFVPVQLALQLQQSGEYLAALDWWQTVYAYHLPSGQRKTYAPLALELTEPRAIERKAEWLGSLNPHQVAATRTNAVSRFTLLSLARCFLEYADAEFTRGTDESRPRARALYMTALDLLDSDEMRQAEAGSAGRSFPPNPVPGSLRLRAELNLFKLRTGRNFAGMRRELETVGRDGAPAALAPVVGLDGRVAPPRTAPLRPTPYYFRVLMERSKQLVGIAQQVEAAYLAALERTDIENYGLLQAGHALDLASAHVQLQGLRKTEAAAGEELANRQQARAVEEAGTYSTWLKAPENRYEAALVKNYREAREHRDWMAGLDAAITAGQALNSAASGGFFGTGLGGGLPIALAVSVLAIGRADSAMKLNNTEMEAQINSLRASQELRKQDWQLRESLANQDVLIAAQQIQIAKDHVAVVTQEHAIAETQSAQAKAIADFLASKFTNAELYEWMSSVLAQVYGYFLRQATAVAQLAQQQLAFERQEATPAFIQADYWQVPSERGSNGATGAADGEEPDRRGLTGSARLLQDVHRLDQHAFETNKRKLQLTQTISLAQAFPFEFQAFRETGLLRFATPMELFDRAFPGHYLRLIRRVRTSVVALVPPNQGIRASLSASGLSRVVTGDGFPTVVVRRDPELVALSSPLNATGLFDLDVQSEMLLPFEGMGVDTSWEFELPKAANPFDYRTIADVLVTIDYTALHSHDYRRQVIASLDPRVGADRSFSLRDSFPDQWYDLLNPAQSATPLVVRFATTRDDFPPNVDDLRIEHLALGFVRSDGEEAEITVSRLHLRQGASISEGGTATSVNGFINTRSGSGSTWTWQGVGPIGEWELALDPSARPLLEQGKIEDVMFVVSYGGQTPAWPA